MTKAAFERYVHWDHKWNGPTEEVFNALEEDNCGYIRNSRLLELKRWYRHYMDKGENNTEAFKRRLEEHFGSLGRAWRLALDTESSGRCCFNHFCRVCHNVGIIRHLRTIWSDLTDGDMTRSISYKDLDPQGEMVIQQFATSLALLGGTMIQGWRHLIRESGGHLHRDSFIERCADWGFTIQPAKWLFKVLDPHNTRYLTEFNDLDFLGMFDPGPLNPKQGGLLQPQVTGSGTAANPFHISGVGAKEGQRPFDLTVIMTVEEHETYINRIRSRQLIAGVDFAGEAKRSNKTAIVDDASER